MSSKSKQVQRITTVEHVGLTVTAVRKGIDIPATVEQVAASLAGVKRAGSESMADAALLTHAVVTADAIGKHDGAMYAKQADYADALGVVPSYVTRLRLLGRAMVVHGVRKGSAEYTWLTQHASRVSGVINADDTAAFRATLADAMRPALADADRNEEGTPTRSPGTGPQNDAQPEQERTDAPPTAGDALARLREIESILKTLGKRDAERVHAALLKVVASDRKRREATTVTGTVVAQTG